MSYSTLLSGSTRVRNYAGLVMIEGYKQVPALKDTVYAEIPILGATIDDGTTGTLTMTIKRNQHVWIAAAGSIDVKGQNFVEVEPNPHLAELGQVQGMYRVHPGSGKKELGFWFTARRDVDLTELTYAVRLYMPS